MVSAAQRFWSNVCIGSENECWPYLGHLLPTGHGQFCTNRRRTSAHRFALSLYQDVPKSAIVCHTCDNPSCVNPKHLYAGSYSDNAQDSIRAKRFYRPDNSGQRHGMAKLTEADVIKIRSLPISSGKAAKSFGVSRSTICAIRNRSSWRHVA